VRLTRDRQVVVFHDRSLRRLTGAEGNVDELDAARVTSLRLVGTDERVPLLREVLDLVHGRVPLLIELKSSPLWPELEPAVLEMLDGYRGEVAIQSFKRRALREHDRRAAPHAGGHLWRWRPVPAAGVRPAFFGRHVAGVPMRAVSPRRGTGAIVLAWTVRSPEQAARAMRFVDNYIFENFVPGLRDGHPLSAPQGAVAASP
jgi:glycerophosphoryl diester phosphodiesterase